MSVEFSDVPQQKDISSQTDTPRNGESLGVEQKPASGIHALAAATDAHPQSHRVLPSDESIVPGRGPIASQADIYTPHNTGDDSIWPDGPPPDWTPSEAEIRAGDGDAWSAWIEARSDKFRGVAARVVGVDKADDVMQEGWAKAYRAREGYREGTADGWVHRITTNAAIDVVRRENRIRQTPTEHAEMPEPIDALTAHTSPPFHTPEEGSGDEATGITLLADKLKDAGVYPDFVDALALNLSGLSYQEIADQTGATLGTVRSRLNRGKEAVGKLIAAGEADTIFDPDMLEQYTGKKTDTPEV